MRNRSKTAFFVVLTAIALTTAALADLVFAQVRHPGLLPNNPFYFVKDALWQLRRALVIDQSAKAEVEIKFLEQKGGEIQKLLQLRPNDAQSLEVAVSAYRQGLKQLDHYLKDSNGELQADLLRLALTHSLLFDELGLADLRNEVLSFLFRYFDRELIAEVVADWRGPFGEIRTAELLQSGSNDWQVARLNEDLLLRFLARIKKGEINVEELLKLTGNLLVRLQVLDEARERVAETELKSKLNLWRQKILEQIDERGLATAGANKALIDYLESLQLVNQAKYLLERGQKLFNEGNYLASLGYLTASQAVGENDFFQNNLTKKEWAEEIALLKKQYDQVARRAPAALEKRRDEADKETAALNYLASRIAFLADLSRTNPKSDELLNGIREIKLLLFQLR